MASELWSERLLASERGRMTKKQLSIIVAAVELFGEQGYANTSTRQIAERAGVSEGAIFKHYATKKELLLQISRLIIKNAVTPLLDSGLAELFAQPYDDLEDFLRKFLQNRLELIEQNVIMIRVLIQEAMFEPEIRRDFLAIVADSHLSWGIEQLRERGLLPPLPVEELAGLLLTNFIGYIFSRYIMLPELFCDRYERDSDSFVRFLAHGLGAFMA